MNDRFAPSSTDPCPRAHPVARHRLLVGALLCVALLGSPSALLAAAERGWVELAGADIKGNQGLPLRIRCQWLGNRLSSKRPVAPLHGFLERNGLRGTFRHNCKQWAQDRPVVMLDLAGFGESSGRSSFSQRMADHATVLAAAFKKLGVTEVHGVGHSLGGGVFSALGANHAEDVHIGKLVLVSSIGVPFDMPRRGQWMAEPGPGGKFASLLLLFDRVFTNYKRGLYFDPANLGKEATAHSLAWLKKPGARRATRRALRSMLHDVGDAWRVNVLEKIKAEKTHALWGQEDTLLRPEIGRELARIVGADFHAFEESGHFPMIERPNAFTQRVTDILSAP